MSTRRAAASPRAATAAERDRPALLEHLAAAMAHEIRNPLNSMSIHLELLDARGRRLPPSDGESIRRSLGVLAQEVSRIDAMLVRYLRHAGPRPTGRRRSTAADLLERAALRAAPAAAARGARIELDVPRSRWRLDPAATALLLDELLANAADAARRGGLIRVALLPADGAVAIEITDDGEGIAADALPRIFALGFTTRPGREGIGLTVARQVVKGLGGSLTASSPGPGRGATFRAELPL